MLISGNIYNFSAVLVQDLYRSSFFSNIWPSK